MTEEIKVNKKAVWIMLVILLIVVALIFFFVRGNSESSDTEIILSGQIGSELGDIAPDFTITGIDGRNYPLNEFKDKQIILSFFAAWCIPCQIEANNIKKIDDETGGNKFVVYQIGVDNRENQDDLKKFKSEFGNEDWIVGFGFDVANLYKVRNLDTTLIINKEGNVVYRDNGVPASIEILDKWLK